MNLFKNIFRLLCFVCLALAAQANAADGTQFSAPFTFLVSGSGSWANAVSGSSPTLSKSAGDTTDVLYIPLPVNHTVNSQRHGFRSVTLRYTNTAASDAVPTFVVAKQTFTSNQQTRTALTEASESCVDSAGAAATTAAGHYVCTITLSGQGASASSASAFWLEATFNGSATSVFRITQIGLSE